MYRLSDCAQTLRCAGLHRGLDVSTVVVVDQENDENGDHDDAEENDPMYWIG